jgi:hypothetical protein
VCIEFALRDRVEVDSQLCNFIHILLYLVYVRFTIVRNTYRSFRARRCLICVSGIETYTSNFRLIAPPVLAQVKRAVGLAIRCEILSLVDQPIHLVTGTLTVRIRTDEGVRLAMFVMHKERIAFCAIVTTTLPKLNQCTTITLKTFRCCTPGNGGPTVQNIRECMNRNGVNTYACIGLMTCIEL